MTDKEKQEKAILIDCLKKLKEIMGIPCLINFRQRNMEGFGYTVPHSRIPIVRIRKQASLRWRIVYLCHEMIHVRQRFHGVNEPHYNNPDWIKYGAYGGAVEKEAWGDQWWYAAKLLPVLPCDVKNSLRKLILRKVKNAGNLFPEVKNE